MFVSFEQQYLFQFSTTILSGFRVACTQRVSSYMILNKLIRNKMMITLLACYRYTLREMLCLGLLVAVVRLRELCPGNLTFLV